MAPALPVVLAGDRVERLAALFDAHYDRLYRLASRLSYLSSRRRQRLHRRLANGTICKKGTITRVRTHTEGSSSRTVEF
jgi:hypothetical protein